ncbi:MAG: 50S ribosomal protein L18, partial [Candidatus Dormibacteraceae bacterium]
MLKQFDRQASRRRRHRRVRVQVRGTADRPRLSVYRSLHHLYVQVIDDAAGRTLVATSTVQLKTDGNDLEAAQRVGRRLAELAKENGVGRVVFDRGGFLYHGRVKALAEA